MNKRVLVLGLGDTNQGDEGVGVHVINYLREKNCLKNAEIVDGTLVQSNLAEPFSGVEQLIVVEVADLNSVPGSVKVFEGIEMDAFLGKDKMPCVHTSGLQYILNMTRTQGHLPNHRALVGIQPEYLSHGDKPSDKVEKAIPRACQKVFEITSNWII